MISTNIRHHPGFILSKKVVYTHRQLAMMGRRPLKSLHLDYGFSDVRSFLKAVKIAYMIYGQAGITSTNSSGKSA